jgi:hypothetical protein
MIFDRCIRWTKLSDLVRELGQTQYIVLKKMEEYDIRYASDKDGPFFLSKEFYGDPLAIIAKESGIEKEHLQKRALPDLKKDGFVDYRQAESGQWQFKINWDRLSDVYREKALGIPFQEGGLRDIPPGYSGVIRPTPMHHVRIVKGKPVPWEGGKAETSAEEESRGTGEALLQEVEQPLREALRSLNPPMNKKEIDFCLERKKETEAALGILDEMDPNRREEIENEAAYVLELVRRGLQEPAASFSQTLPAPAISQGIPGEKQAHAKFLYRMIKERRCTHFCPGNGVRWEITIINDDGFVVRKEDGEQPFIYFNEKMKPEQFE